MFVKGIGCVVKGTGSPDAAQQPASQCFGIDLKGSVDPLTCGSEEEEELTAAAAAKEISLGAATAAVCHEQKNRKATLKTLFHFTPDWL